MTTIGLSGIVGDPKGITAAGLRKQLEAGGDDVHVKVTSEGGDFLEAVGILNMLRNYPKRVTAHVEGMALSAGTIILLGASTVTADADSLLMVHEGQVAIEHARADDLRRVAAQLEAANRTLVELYRTRTRRTEEDVAAALRAEKWMTAGEAQKWGLVDKVLPVKARVRNCVDPARWPNAPERFHAPPISERAARFVEDVRRRIGSAA